MEVSKDGGGKIDVERVPFVGPLQGKKAVYYPFDKLEVGMSFTAPAVAAKLYESSRRFKKKGHAHMVFRVRDLPEGGCRVWRVK